jgi:Glycosyltransferase family 87
MASDRISLIPLRLTLERVWLYAICCATIVSLPFFALRWFPKVAYAYDFACFWSAGATVGTSTLTNPQRLYEWAHARHMIAQPFSYPPGFAWFYAPLSRLTPINGLVIEELLMIAIFLWSAIVAARVYCFNPWFCVAAMLGWAPAINSIEVGQNSALAVLFIFVTALGMVRRRPAMTGLGVGLLLYKPSLALPMLLLLGARKEWRALGIALLFALGWYFVSVAASGGDWSWPVTYAHTMAWWLPMDFLGGTSKAFTIPTLLMTHGLSITAAALIGIAILLAALPVAARASAIEAASMMPLVGLAASLHAWPYEAAVALPAILYAMTVIREPLRTPVIAVLYGGIAILLITRWGAAALATLCIGATLAWFFSSTRRGAYGIISAWPVPPIS